MPRESIPDATAVDRPYPGQGVNSVVFENETIGAGLFLEIDASGRQNFTNANPFWKRLQPGASWTIEPADTTHPDDPTDGKLAARQFSVRGQATGAAVLVWTASGKGPLRDVPVRAR